MTERTLTPHMSAGMIDCMAMALAQNICGLVEGEEMDEAVDRLMEVADGFLDAEHAQKWFVIPETTKRGVCLIALSKASH